MRTGPEGWAPPEGPHHRPASRDFFTSSELACPKRLCCLGAFHDRAVPPGSRPLTAQSRTGFLPVGVARDSCRGGTARRPERARAKSSDAKPGAPYQRYGAPGGAAPGRSHPGTCSSFRGSTGAAAGRRPRRGKRLSPPDTARRGAPLRGADQRDRIRRSLPILRSLQRGTCSTIWLNGRPPAPRDRRWMGRSSARGVRRVPGTGRSDARTEAPAGEPTR